MQISVNGAAIQAPQPTTLSALLEQLKLGGQRLAVELNGEIIVRSQHAQTTLKDGDRLEIVQAIGGG